MKRANKTMFSFFKDESGSQTIVFVILLPLLVWSILAMLAFTDMFRVRAIATDATAVIADSLSRQTMPIDADHLEGLQSIAGHLTRYGDGVSLRVTQLRCARNCENLARRVLRVDFSQGVGMAGLRNRDFSEGEQRARVPLMTGGDRVVLVETSFTHEPIANVGLNPSEINMSHATRMRFAPQLCWEECTIDNAS
ncbi:hypothetical protein DSM14862_03647 (plasmid) [Sulfitobacter indolifex]|nr:hypothetical protein [Sulfitobacter indolifex]UOA20622.1 hypothetical protein DSM14862_03460 [Sulfitobacter indolifex]UOA20809.1 hypothetical protein DSM14862_03647 [Sulfitobacter indolifex]